MKTGFGFAIFLAGAAVVAFVATAVFRRIRNRVQAEHQEAIERYEVELKEWRAAGDASQEARPSRPTAQGRLQRSHGRAAASMTIGCALTGLVVLLVVFNSLAIVGTKRVGVVTSFNKPVGTLSNGAHLIWPWEAVHEMDATIQTDNLTGDRCVTIRMAGDATGCVDVTVRWRITTDSAADLYRDYRNIDIIRDSVVLRDLTAALNEEFGDFDPLDALARLATTGGDESDVAEAGNLGERADSVTEGLRVRTGDRVEIQSITIPYIDYDTRTQGRINDFLTEVANTRIATQRQQTAAAQAEANQALVESVDDPNVLVSRCLDVLTAMVEADQPVPAGFSCWPGGGTGVVLPATSPPER